MANQRIFLLAFLLQSLQLFSQEKEIPLRYNAQAAQRFQEEQRYPARQMRGGGAPLELPFFDDFSRYSLATSNPAIPEEWQMWEDNNVFINCTYPVSPMTIGVATLDGLDSDGTPYSDTLYFPTITESFLDWGLADSLTSMPLALSGYTPEDSVFLVFHYEGGGFGNAPDADGILGAEGDSLILEFYSPLQQGQWFRKWAVQGGGNANAFDTVFIHVDDLIFLQDGFKFRFKNYCTQHGALDHWHLDYVIVNNNISPSNFFYDEVAFQYCNNTLLNFGYTSMPWTHFLSNPELYMMDEFTYYQRNLGETQNIATKWRVETDGVQQFESVINANTQNNGYSEISRTVSLEGYVYDDDAATDSASFEVCVAFNPTDIHPENDTMCFTQVFHNYYAYDDGTAERAYGLQNAGGKVAMKFNNVVPDTMLGVYMYFMPIQYLATDQTFILQAWDDASGVPGSLLTSDFDNFNFAQPHYYASGPNLFVYYEFTDSVFVDQGDFYVGYVQQSEVSLNMGLDKNTTANATKLFYQLQGQTAWEQSEIIGSVMIRPVFKSGLPQWVDVAETTLEISDLFPNPTEESIQFMMHPDNNMYTYRVLDISGRIIQERTFRNNGQITLSVSDLDSGQYMLQIISDEQHQQVVKRFMKF